MTQIDPWAMHQKKDLFQEAIFLMNVYTQRPQVVAALVSAIALLASVLTCMVVYAYQWYFAWRRRQSNALAVHLAENAPVCDDWEHQLEKQCSMNPAPSESEDDDRSCGVSRV